MGFEMQGIPPSKTDSLFEMLDSGEAITREKIDPMVFSYFCSLSFCVQTFSGRTKAGILEQSPLPATWNQWQPLDPSNTSWTLTGPTSDPAIDDPSAYRIDNASAFALNQAFTTVLGGPIYAVRTNLSSSAHAWTMDFGSGNGGFKGAALQAFWAASETPDALAAYLARVAASLTTWLRTRAPAAAPDPRYAPTVFASVVLVRVRWLWLIYPLSLFAVSFVFFSATVWRTRRLRVRPWKAHRVPLLLARIDGVVAARAAGGLGSRQGLEERVGKMRVRLDYDDIDEIVFRRAP